MSGRHRDILGHVHHLSLLDFSIFVDNVTLVAIVILADRSEKFSQHSEGKQTSRTLSDEAESREEHFAGHLP